MVLMNSIWFSFYLTSWKRFHKSGFKGNSLRVCQPPYQPAWLLAISTTRWLVLGQVIVPTERISPLVIIHLFIPSRPNRKFIFQALKLSSKDWVITMEMDVGIWEASDHIHPMIRLLNALNTNKVVLPASVSFLRHTLSGPNNYTCHIMTTILTLTRQTLSPTFPGVQWVCLCAHHHHD